MKVNFWTWSAPLTGAPLMQLKEGIALKGRPVRLWGDILPVTGQKISLKREPQENVTLLMVQTRAGVQNYDARSMPHFEETNTWIGADCAPTLYQRGKWDNPDKRQLFRLREGEYVLFFDALGEVTMLMVQQCGKKPELARATDGEVANYIITEAKKRGHNPSARTWCFHALQELGCRSQIDKFYKMFPDFHRT